MLAYDTPEQKCFVNRWAPRQLPRYPDSHSRLVLTPGNSLGWHNSVAGENNTLLRRHLVLPQCNGTISLQGEPLGTSRLRQEGNCSPLPCNHQRGEVQQSCAQGRTRPSIF
ncbi:unnamed protein product [Staurois parvus]|uniref:Uncharacterized protein n=1 Tax=Staurois parvus TaxID=386267 RepID=A0ABN9G830_9NEOB|nr:unnamed protein product [Staurois parvus]